MQIDRRQARGVLSIALILLIVALGSIFLSMASRGGLRAGSQGALAIIGGGSSPYDTPTGNITTGVGIFTEATIALTVGVLFIGAFSLQVARNYFLRTLDKFTLRLGADIWWLAYVLIRDGLMFFALLLGFEIFYVGTYGDYPIAVPFMPVALVLVALALLTKLIRDADEEERTNRVVTTLITVATGLYLVGLLMVTESIIGYPAAGYVMNPDGTIATATNGSDVWTFFFNNFSSTVNVSLATMSFYVCFTILSIVAVIAFLFVMKPSRQKAPGKTLEDKGPSKSPSTRDAVVQPAAGKTNGGGP